MSLRIRRRTRAPGQRIIDLCAEKVWYLRLKAGLAPGSAPNAPDSPRSARAAHGYNWLPENRSAAQTGSPVEPPAPTARRPRSSATRASGPCAALAPISAGLAYTGALPPKKFPAWAPVPQRSPRTSRQLDLQPEKPPRD